MMLYLLLTMLLVLQVRGLMYMSKVRRDDEIKSRFCELQGEIATFMCTDEALTLSKSDYLHLRRLLTLSNSAVRRFELMKPNLNFRYFLRKMREVNSSVLRSEMKMESVHNETIQGFYAAFTHCVIRGFFAYTPFLRHEIVLRVLKMLVSLLAKYGTDRLRRTANEVQQIVVNLNNHEQEHGVALAA